MEIVLKILPLFPVADLLALMLVSRGTFALVLPLIDETLWNHVHYGDLRWILLVSSVKREVKRANTAAKEWFYAPSGLGFESILDSKQFPFA
jgi:hypothetical protein